MKKIISALITTIIMTSAGARAEDSLDSLKTRLSGGPVQEKVFIHMDNTCYFVGDTIWYKAYVVRADSLTYTDMSRILYVELVSPDGLVVERQRLIISPKGYSNGDIALKDSLYSGYYELRAYTRWMLNFDVTEHEYRKRDRLQFYDDAMAKDFFRKYGTLYSRVFPVYEQPDSAGDFTSKGMYQRPKTRLDKPLTPTLHVAFFPEGGHLIAGCRQRVALEVTDENGKGVEVSNNLVTTDKMGRGIMAIDVPADGTLEKITFSHGGKTYRFDMPKAETQGVALTLDAFTGKVTLSGKGYDAATPLAAAVLCRGTLKFFEKINLGSATLSLPLDTLPTGVNDLLILDAGGHILADRLFFVNNHDRDAAITVSGMKSEYQPYEKASLTFTCPDHPNHISVSVRDGATDEASYYDGNIMTDMLLSSELKGFIAHPARYFDGGGGDLDLLMMVQGWRRYDASAILAAPTPRYKPEAVLTVEGSVHKTVDFPAVEQNEVGYWKRGMFGYSKSDMDALNSAVSADDSDQVSAATKSAITDAMSKGQSFYFDGTEVYSSSTNAVSDYLVETKTNKAKDLDKEVTVHGELIVGTDVATVDITTTRGRFAFDLPPFWGDGILKLSAIKSGAGERKTRKMTERGVTDEEQWPDFYVKRDLFFPVFADKYSYYQTHKPEEENTAQKAETDGYNPDMAHHVIKTVHVKGHMRSGSRIIDLDKPAYVFDAYELYNLATDYGLSYGKLNFRRFPYQLSMLLLGNYGGGQAFNVDGRLNHYLFYRNYNPDETADLRNLSEMVGAAENLESASSSTDSDDSYSETTDTYTDDSDDLENGGHLRSEASIYTDLWLRRLDQIRFYTDFELRNEDKNIEMEHKSADVTVDFMTFPDNIEQYSFRDRNITLHSYTMPSDFYNPDYSKMTPKAGADSRRTLYWNANAVPDGDGIFTATFYTGGKRSALKAEAEGIGRSGKLLHQ